MTGPPSWRHPDPAWLQRGLAGGAVASAAALGLLFGLGRRAGTTWRPLNAAAHTLLGATADGVWTFQQSVTPVGGLVVLAMSAMAALVVARIASPFRTLHVVVTTAGVVLVGYLLHVHVIARRPGGLAALLTVGELRALYLTLGLALVIGMRFAFSAAATASARAAAPPA